MRTSCSRCDAVGCVVNAEVHGNVYELPTSFSKRWAPSKQEMGQWCECCLGQVLRQVKPASRRFLQLLAKKPDEFIETGLSSVEDQRCTLDFSMAIHDLGLGVLYPEMSRPPAHSNASWRYGWPFAFDERRVPKRYLLPSKGADLVNSCVIVPLD